MRNVLYHLFTLTILSIVYLSLVYIAWSLTK
jgi:hypothetical protein